MDIITKIKLRKLRLFYIQVMAKYGRGKGQFGVYNDLFQLTVMAGLGIEMWNKNVPDLQIPTSVLIPGVVFLIFFFMAWGFIDQKLIKLTQAESAYSNEVLNPWIVKQFEDIKKEIRELKK